MPSLTRHNNKRRHHTAPANLSRTAMNHRGLRFNKKHHTKARAANAMIAKIKANAKAAANANASATRRRRR
jgi:hypothetical protein